MYYIDYASSAHELTGPVDSTQCVRATGPAETEGLDADGFDSVHPKCFRHENGVEQRVFDEDAAYDKVLRALSSFTPPGREEVAQRRHESQAL
ncbi:hypothetical protein [Streptomyces sp. NPDC048473]|uniref:hypothetical protein n=1 Tax=unclassified Streptomyces TaxID=2593676 RepID=UPI003721B5A7